MARVPSKQHAHFLHMLSHCNDGLPVAELRSTWKKKIMQAKAAPADDAEQDHSLYQASSEDDEPAVMASVSKTATANDSVENSEQPTKAATAVVVHDLQKFALLHATSSNRRLTGGRDP